MKKNIIVFRKRLLAYSETFIADQGQYLPSMKALFAGFRRDPSGIDILPQYSHCLQEDYSSFASLDRLRLRLDLGINGRWRKALQKSRPLLLHAHFGPDALAAIPIAKDLNIPLIATFHGFDITKKTSSTNYIKRRQLIFEHAHTIIAVSKFIKQKLIEAGCQEQKIVQHYIGINTEHFTADKIENDKPTIVFIGRLVHKKGCGYLLDAMKKVQKQVPETRIQIIGNGPLRNELERQAEELNHVEFLGIKNKHEIKNLLSKAWIFCTPSIVAESGDTEGLGMVFLEAQALGTPAVSFDTGGVIEAIAHGKTGMTVPEKNVDALAESLLQLLQDKSLRSNIGKFGAERIRDKFDIRKQCEKLEKIYRDVISGAKR